MKQLPWSLTMLVVLAHGLPAHADGPGTFVPPASLWNKQWPQVTWPEIGAFAALEAVAIVGPLVASKPAHPRWRGGILFDDAIQDALVVHSGRSAITTGSDVGLYVLQALPLVDAAVSAWWLRRDRGTALQLAIIDLESYALSSALVWSLKTTVARARPRDLHLGCYGTGALPPACAKTKNTSFPSEHAATTFTAASLFCVEHSHVELYGASADAWACAGALAAATGVSLARIIADNHFATDVLAGAAIGLGSGLLVPTLLHFHSTSRTDSASQAGLGIVPLPTPWGFRVAAVGVL